MKREEYESISNKIINKEELAVGALAHYGIAENYIYSLEQHIKDLELCNDELRNEYKNCTTALHSKQDELESPKNCKNCSKKMTHIGCEIDDALTNDGVFINNFYCSEWDANNSCNGCEFENERATHHKCCSCKRVATDYFKAKQ